MHLSMCEKLSLGKTMRKTHTTADSANSRKWAMPLFHIALKPSPLLLLQALRLSFLPLWQRQNTQNICAPSFSNLDAPDSLTPLYEDNMSAINMISDRVPRERSRHIDIQHFAIQNWANAKDIIMRHISGILSIPSSTLMVKLPSQWTVFLHASVGSKLTTQNPLVLSSYQNDASLLASNVGKQDCFPVLANQYFRTMGAEAFLCLKEEELISRQKRSEPGFVPACSHLSPSKK